MHDLIMQEAFVNTHTNKNLKIIYIVMEIVFLLFNLTKDDSSKWQHYFTLVRYFWMHLDYFNSV